MKLIRLAPTPFAALVALALLAMLGLQTALQSRLLAPRLAEVAQLARTLKEQQHSAHDKRAPLAPPQVRLEAVLARLGLQPANQARVERLHKIAEQQAVTLRKASYLSKAQGGGILRHEIQADLGGSYPAIREFLQALLQQDDGAALESVEFSRPPGGTGVRTQVRLVLYSRL